MAVYLSSLCAIRTTVTFIVSECQFLMIPNSFHCSSYSTQGAQVHSHMWSSGKPIKAIKLDTLACYSKHTATSSEPQKYGNLCMWLTDMFPFILLQHQVTSLYFAAKVMEWLLSPSLTNTSLFRLERSDLKCTCACAF